MSTPLLSHGPRCRIIVAACLTICLAACGLTVQQRSAVRKFSAATMDFATLTSSEFVKSRTDVLEMNKLRIQLKDDTADPKQMDEHFTTTRVKVRVDAVTALREYAELLQILVTSSQTDQLKNAADSFVASLRKVQGVNLSDEKAGAIGLAIQQVGGLVVEYMRAKAAREVVTATHPVILQVLQLVERDFSPTADHWSLGYEKVVIELERAAALAGTRPDGATSAALIGEAQVVAEQNRARFNSIAAQVANSVIALRQAQINLRYVLQSTDVTIEDINGYVAQIEDFVKVYRILRDK